MDSQAYRIKVNVLSLAFKPCYTCEWTKEWSFVEAPVVGTCIYISSFNSHNSHVKQESLALFYRWKGLGPIKNQMIKQREPISNKYLSQEFSTFFRFTTLPFPHPNTYNSTSSWQEFFASFHALFTPLRKILLLLWLFKSSLSFKIAQVLAPPWCYL